VANFKIFVYDTWTRYEHNQLIIYTRTAGINTGDDTFLAGVETVEGRKVKYFQFGVEASTHIGEYPGLA